MAELLERRGYLEPRRVLAWLIVAGVLAVAAGVGRLGPLRAGLAVAALLGAGVVLWRPGVALPALIAAALVVPLQFGTGTEVWLNPAALLAPCVIGAWVAIMVGRRQLSMPRSRTTAPLLAFLAAGVLSLVVGNAIWDPTVLRSSNFLLVQLAQLAIFGFSAGVFWAAADWLRAPARLRRTTFFFLALGGTIAIAYALPGGDALVPRLTTFALYRAPFWVLLAALTLGQLLFNRTLGLRWRVFLIATTVAVAVYAFGMQKERLSNMIGVAVVVLALVMMRWPRLRGLIVAGVVVAGVAAWPWLYQYAGGESKWQESGASRLALTGRVIELSMRNPITGLGPAAYRPYGKMQSLAYGGAIYHGVALSSHNNYVDLFSQMGVLGLAIFLWFAGRLTASGARVRARYPAGFEAGFAAGALAGWLALLAIMVLADWLLPFVYNIGFPGFQASIIAWLFMGGLVALEGRADADGAPR